MNKAVLILFFIFFAVLSSFALEVEPGDLSYFNVTAAKPVTAGVQFGIKIEAKDAFDNTVTNFDKRKTRLELISSGSGRLTPDYILPSDFNNGVAVINCVYDKAEKIRITVRETINNISSSSDLFDVYSGELSSFKVDFPSTIHAGREFEFSITALDRFGNVIEDFNKHSNGSVINSSGVGKITPQIISPDRFVKGTAFVKGYYDAAEVIRFEVADQKNTVRVISESAVVMPGDLAKFVLTLPKTAAAGRNFSASIEARDKFDNIVINYARIGNGVEFSTNGFGALSPSYIPASNFDNGVAFVSLNYTAAETVRIFVQERGKQLFGQSENITFSSGRYSRFIVNTPSRGAAAENFQVSIRAVDEYNNLVKDYASLGKDIFVRVIGSVRRPAEKISASQFTDGTAFVNLVHDAAEEVYVEVYCEDNYAKGASSKIRIFPGPPSDFKITVPQRAVAGEPVTVSLAAADKFGNLVENYNEIGPDIILYIEGSGREVSVNISASRFSKGVMRTTLTYEKAEKVSAIAKTSDSRIFVKSGIIEITPAYLDRFDVLIPEQIEAGEAFTLRLTAYDKFNNLLTHYNLTGKGARLHSNGVGTVIPAVVNASQFNNGTAEIQAYYYTSEMINITAVERQSIEMGSSSLMKVNPAAVSHFMIYSPPKITAGGPFIVKIEAQDKYFNTVRDYSRIGEGLRLSPSGAGRFIPQTIDASEFKNGVAVISLIYDSVGEFRFMAKTESGVEGLSKNINSEPASFDKFEVEVFPPIRAGEPFKAQIKAADAYGNLIPEASRLPGGARIFTTGTGLLSPHTVSPKAFKNGLAEMNFIYDKAESIKISANLVSMPDDYLTVEDVIYKTSGNRFEVILIANAPITNQDVRIIQPRLMIADIPAANLAVKQRRVEFEDENLSSITVTQEALEPMPVVRLSIAMKEYAPYTIDLKENILIITFTKEQTETKTEKIDLKTEPSAITPIETIPPVLKDLREDEFIVKAKRLIRIEQYEAAMDNIKEALRINPDSREAKEIFQRLDRILNMIR